MGLKIEAAVIEAAELAASNGVELLCEAVEDGDATACYYAAWQLIEELNRVVSIYKQEPKKWK